MKHKYADTEFALLCDSCEDAGLEVTLALETRGEFKKNLLVKQAFFSIIILNEHNHQIKKYLQLEGEDIEHIARRALGSLMQLGIIGEQPES